MSITEARDYVDGVNRRYRQSWEQTRLLYRLYYSAKTGEEAELPFPWDAPEETISEEEEEIRLQAMRQRAKELEKYMNDGNIS